MISIDTGDSVFHRHVHEGEADYGGNPMDYKTTMGAYECRSCGATLSQDAATKARASTGNTGVEKMNLPPIQDRLRQYAHTRDGMTGDPTLEQTFRDDMHAAADALLKLEKVRGHVMRWVGNEIHERHVLSALCTLFGTETTGGEIPK